jgi:hypothetical protein
LREREREGERERGREREFSITENRGPGPLFIVPELVAELKYTNLEPAPFEAQSPHEQDILNTGFAPQEHIPFFGTVLGHFRFLS